MAYYVHVTVGAADILDYLQHSGIPFNAPIIVDAAFEDAIIIRKIAKIQPKAMTALRLDTRDVSGRVLRLYGIPEGIAVEISTSFIVSIGWLKALGAVNLDSAFRQFSIWIQQQPDEYAITTELPVIVNTVPSQAQKNKPWGWPMPDMPDFVLDILIIIGFGGMVLVGALLWFLGPHLPQNLLTLTPYALAVAIMLWLIAFMQQMYRGVTRYQQEAAYQQAKRRGYTG